MDFDQGRRPNKGRLSSIKPWLFPLLWLGAGLYGLGVRLRLVLYRFHLLPARRLPLKVISIGNLTAGGTGKTPHTALLARYLQKKGIKTAVLSRGYRGTKTKEGAVISDGHSLLGTVEEGGEEAFLLARKLPGVPVLVGKDRFGSGMLCARKWQTEWVVLDDGFQHIRLKRDVDILLWPAHLPLGSVRLLPLGFLREPIKELKRADVILITHSDRPGSAGLTDLAEAIHRRVPATPIFYSRHKPVILWSYPDQKSLPLSWLEKKRLLAFCGLAEPESLNFTLKQLQVDPVEVVSFPDHHYYQEEDKRFLENLGRTLQVELMVTTEKDAVKLGKWEAVDLPVLVLCIEVEIQVAEFWDWLDQMIGIRQKA